MSDKIERACMNDARPTFEEEAAFAAAAPESVGDDIGCERKAVKPAMAGIPTGAVQMMPVSASPGPPPVDPQEREPRRGVVGLANAGDGTTPRRRETAARRVLGRRTVPRGRRHWMDARYRTTPWRAGGA